MMMMCSSTQAPLAPPDPRQSWPKHPLRQRHRVARGARPPHHAAGQAPISLGRHGHYDRRSNRLGGRGVGAGAQGSAPRGVKKRQAFWAAAARATGRRGVGGRHAARVGVGRCVTCCMCIVRHELNIIIVCIRVDSLLPHREAVVCVTLCHFKCTAPHPWGWQRTQRPPPARLPLPPPDPA